MNIFKSYSYLSGTLPNTRNKWFLTCYARSMTSVLAPTFLGGSKVQRSTCWRSAERKLLRSSVSEQVSTTGKKVCMCEGVNLYELANYWQQKRHLSFIHASSAHRCFSFFSVTLCSLSHKVTSVQGQRAQHLNLMKSPYGLFSWLTETLVSFYSSCLDYLF